MKQLIKIEAGFLKRKDSILDMRTRELIKVDDVCIRYSDGEVHVTYYDDKHGSDYFQKEDKVFICIDADELRVKGD